MAKKKRNTPPAVGSRSPGDEDLVHELRELVSLIGFLGELDTFDLDPDDEPYVRQAIGDRLLVVAKSSRDCAEAALKALPLSKAVA